MELDPGFLPRGGLSVPVLTALDASGGLDEASQRRLLRHVLSGGSGADIVFAGGTTGEAMALSDGVRRALLECCVDEMRGMETGPSRRAELWAGVTSRDEAGTLALLGHAVKAGADAVVIAPLSIAGLEGEGLLRFFRRGVREVLEASGRMIPVFLYDNADIAADPRVPHLRTATVKQLSRLGFVRGVKVSAPMPVLGNYAKAARHFHARGAFGIYVGNARLVFEIFDTDKGPFRRHMDRFLLNASLPVGVVAGQANLFPREWQDAWRVSVGGDDEEASRYRVAFEKLSQACRPAGGPRALACLKRALHQGGILASASLAPGTPTLSSSDAEAFDLGLAGVKRLLASSPARWRTPWPEPEKVIA